MSERKDGWYHVRTGKGWECAEWRIGRWNIVGSAHHYDDSDLEEIGPRIPRPDEVAIPDAVDEALQRLIENSATSGPATQQDALLVGRYRKMLSAPRFGDEP